MASTKVYLNFILEQLSGLDEISSRAMMGEFILYYRGKVFGGIYDDRLLVKPVPVAVKMMPDAEMEPPYDGAKKMILVTHGGAALGFAKRIQNRVNNMYPNSLRIFNL